ncbi:MAG: alpha/beta fold hydrolase [Chloroflexi bacterium]|nr:alpha/beta fold hydrolase [Chloroflexota bacterium]
MNDKPVKSGLAAINNARIYYEAAGEGPPLVMIHAGVADSRQWNNEFAHFADRFHVVRYDLRGYGRSEPVEGDFSHLGDLIALLDYLELHEPALFMGCSMGGGLAINFALTRPSQTAALILVGSGPSGLELDTPTPAKFATAEQAYHAGDFDLLAEIETQIWFDGMERTPDQVNQTMRRLAYEMNRQALSHYAKKLGQELLDTEIVAAEEMSALQTPTLIIVGAHDIPYIHAAADYMMTKLPSARKALIADAAHLSNMDQPEEFRRIVTEFLASSALYGR